MKPLDPLADLPTGVTLIEASAGTGKTYTITSLVLRLLVEYGLRIEQILVVTFTEAATAELQDRVRKRLRLAQWRFEGGPATEDDLIEALVARSEDPALGARRLREAINGFDLAAISTIHGFCRRMLQENAFESGVPFDAELVADQEPLVRQVVEDFWTTTTHDAPELFVRYLRDKRMGPSDLMRLAWLAASDPDMPVLPAQSGPRPRVDQDALRAAFVRFKDAWATGKKQLLDQLKRLRMNHWDYYNDRIDDYRWEIDDWVDVDTLRAPCEALRLLSPHALAPYAAADRLARIPMLGAIQAYLDASDAFQKSLDGQLLQLRLDLIATVRRELPARKQAANVQSFDDLLVKLRDALRDPETGAQLAAAIGQRFQAALIDEFQDTDPIQYEIFHSTLGRDAGRLFLIGDPKQAIYAFRGADVFAYMEAVRHAGDRAFTLDTNWRSDPSLIRAVNGLFSRLQDPFVLPAIRFGPVNARPSATDSLPGAALELRLMRLGDYHRSRRPISKKWARDQLPKRVAAEIVDLLRQGQTGELVLDDGPLQPGDIAVLVRTNAQALDVQEQLRTLGVPSVRHGDASVLDSSDADDLERLLQAVSEPSDRGAVRSVLGGVLFGWSAADLDAMERDESSWDTQVERFRGWKAQWDAQGFARVMRSVVEEHGVQERLLSLPDGERRLTNLLHLGELLHTASIRDELGVVGLLRWLRLQRERGHLSGGDGDGQRLRLESDDRAVQLVTVHKAKGLEYPVVLCPYLWDCRMSGAGDPLLFHDPRSMVRTLDLGSADRDRHRALVDRETRAEGLRLLYVALTRAKHRCIVYWGPVRGYENSPLGYLLHQPQGALQGDVLSATTAHLQGWDDSRMEAELQALAAASDGALSVTRSARRRPTPWGASEAAPPELSARNLHRTVHGNWGITSFSGMTRDPVGHSAGSPVHAGIDRDEAARARAGLGAGPKVSLVDFPRGARAGTFFHAILEVLDFQEPDRDERAELVRLQLERHGYPADTWTDVVTDALDQVLATPILADGLRLLDVSTSQRLDEMQFTVPTAHGLAEPGGRTPTPADLGRLVRDVPDPGLPPGFAESLEALSFTPLQGFLTGFIDLIFEHQGRWYVVDYKSNHLGDHRSDYARDQLPAAVLHGHYALQYLLYTVALDRFLSHRLPGYTYETHFGGVAYLFFKGMHPDLGCESGVFWHRPRQALIDGLSALLSPLGATP